MANGSGQQKNKNECKHNNNDRRKFEINSPARQNVLNDRSTYNNNFDVSPNSQTSNPYISIPTYIPKHLVHIRAIFRIDFNRLPAQPCSFIHIIHHYIVAIWFFFFFRSTMHSNDARGQKVKKNQRHVIVKF